MKSLPAIALGLVLAVMPFASHAHEHATGVVKERMDTMKAMSDAMKALRPLMDQPQIDAAKALPLAEKVRDLSGRTASLFPAGSDGGTSEALPDVWRKPDDFADAARNSTTQAAALVEAIKAGDSAASLKAFARTAKSCKDCHGDFKKAD
ncbi:c-type cytochrome [Insolitispirillum peregrinum]|uniref:Cytochrome c556 n=1 Tax=Insolitispirillum peregrinum TaxID=80876 RepID=A0A1N7IMG1_9PROT|nr:cytochrome c [Insolitispirillum peregrinum]SIS38242.1 Cytochrome c556 [Insolitispirillum peregrinum]